MKTRIVFGGASSLDARIAKRIEAGLAPGGVYFSDPMSCHRLVIATGAPPAPGAKITADQPIARDQLSGFLEAQQPGGGALNQVMRYAEHARRIGSETEVCFIDTSPDCDCVVEVCKAQGIEVVSLARHNCPVNVVSAYGHDKLIVRSPVELDRQDLDRERRRRITTAVDAADVVVCVSPKDAVVARELFQAAPHATRYLQPTGSLPAETTLDLAGDCDGLANNAKELGDWAMDLGMGSWIIDETSPNAAREAATLLTDLRNRFHLPLRVGAITLGRRGCVVVDFHLHRCWEIVILPTDGSVPTPSGAGDFWHALWIYHREIGKLREPDSAVAATKAVAAAIGLQPDEFGVQVTELPMTRRRIDRPHAVALSLPRRSNADCAPRFVESAELGRCLSHLVHEQQQIDRLEIERLASLRAIQDRD